MLIESVLDIVLDKLLLEKKSKWKNRVKAKQVLQNKGSAKQHLANAKSKNQANNNKQTQQANVKKIQDLEAFYQKARQEVEAYKQKETENEEKIKNLTNSVQNYQEVGAEKDEKIKDLTNLAKQYKVDYDEFEKIKGELSDYEKKQSGNYFNFDEVSASGVEANTDGLEKLSKSKLAKLRGEFKKSSLARKIENVIKSAEDLRGTDVYSDYFIDYFIQEIKDGVNFLYGTFIFESMKTKKEIISENKRRFKGLLRESLSMKDVMVNNETEGSTLYKIGLWKGYGYILDIFYVYSDSEGEALDKLFDYLVENELTQYILDEEEYEQYLENLGIDREEDENYMYVDTNRYIGYLMAMNLRIDVVE